MSIINDALKKAQKNLSKKKDKNILKPGIDQPQSNSSFDYSNAGTIKGDKLKILIILTLFLILICMFALLFIILNKKSEKISVSPGQETIIQTTQKSPIISNTENTKTLNAPSNFIKSNKQLREKVAIPSEATIAPADYDKPLDLNGIMTIENKTVALINGSDYEEGDIIHGMKIIEISAKNVKIERIDGKILILSVKYK